MGRPVQRFTVTPAQYAVLVDKATTAGVPITDTNGTATKLGVSVSWSYLEPTLSIQVVKTPFFLSADTVEAKIATVVKEACSG